MTEETIAKHRELVGASLDLVALGEQMQRLKERVESLGGQGYSYSSQEMINAVTLYNQYSEQYARVETQVQGLLRELRRAPPIDRAKERRRGDE